MLARDNIESMKGQVTRMTLIQRVKDRMDQQSWEEFTKFYSPYIMGILNKAGIEYEYVEDLCQDILLRIWKSIENFEYDPDKCKFRTWLGTVCRNCIYNFYERVKKKHNNVDMDESYLPPGEADINEIIENEWQIYIAKKAFEKVSNSFNEKALKSYTEFQKGKDVETIAKEIDVAENTIYVYHRRVKQAMTREILLLVKELE